MQIADVGPEDTIDYRRWEERVGRTIAPFSNRCQKLRQGSKKYLEALTVFASQQRDFGECLAEFGQGNDEDSEAIDGLTLQKLAEIFEDMANVTDQLHTWTQRTVQIHLKDAWLKGVLVKAKEVKKLAEQKRSELESAASKLHSKSNSGGSKFGELFGVGNTSAEKLRADVAHAEVAAYEARCEVLRTFNEMQGMKTFDFMRLYAENARNHSDYYELQSKVLRNLEDLTASSANMAKAHQMTHEDLTADLERRISAYLATSRSRQAELNAEEPAQSSAVSAGTHSQRTLSQRQGSILSSGTDLIENPMLFTLLERDSTTAIPPDSTPRHPQIIKEGFLNKQSSPKFGKKEWQRRFFRLDASGMFYYDPKAHGGSLKDKLTDWRKSGDTAMSLVTANVKPGVDETDPHKQMRFCFRVVDTDRTFNLHASSAEDMEDWIRQLQAMTERLLSRSDVGRQAADAQKAKSHSRGRSWAGSIGSDGDLSNSEPKEKKNWRDFIATPRERRLSIGSPPMSPPPPVPAAAHSPPQPLSSPHREMSLLRISEPAQQSREVGSLTVSRLRQPDGNDRCADCGAQNPEWASLNLGILICLQCSGAHRHLGTDISKVQSLVLDTKVWEGAALDMMAGLGNSAANAVYEECLPRLQEGNDSWVMAENPDDPSSPSGLGDLRKPSEASSPESRERFITAKYKDRRFVAPSKHDQQTLLLLALRRGNLIGVMQAIAKGATPLIPLTLQFSEAIMDEVNDIFPPKHEEEGFVHDGSGIPPVLAACKTGDKSILEFLFLNGAKKNSVDSEGRSLLHYAVILKHSHLVSYLVKRGVDRSLKDKDGQTAAQVARLTGFEDSQNLLVQKTYDSITLPTV